VRTDVLYTQKLSSCLTEDTLLDHFEEQSVNVAKENDRTLLGKSSKSYTQTHCVEKRIWLMLKHVVHFITGP